MPPPDAPPPALLTASGLALSRGGRTLFSGLDITLPAGGIVLVRGPNGAGKSSLLLALAGILRCDAGRIDRGEEPPPLHLLTHQAALKPRLTVAENLDFWRRVNGPTGIPVAAALDTVGLATLGPIAAGHLSAGQGRRLALARLLVSQRSVWLLDEPTAALDAAGRDLLGALLRDHIAGGGGAIVATHDDIPGLGEAPALTLGAR